MTNEQYKFLTYDALVGLFIQASKDLVENIEEKNSVSKTKEAIMKIELLYSEILEKVTRKRDPKYSAFGIAMLLDTRLTTVGQIGM